MGKKRVRRTKKSIEDGLLRAAHELIEEKGFSNVTVSAIAKRADVETPVFYNRYKDIDDLFEKYVRKYDYWLNDSVNFDPDIFSPIDNCKNLLLDLVDSLESNCIMQKLLIWEVSSINPITSRTSENRERHSKVLLDYFNENLKDSGIDFNAFVGLIMGGIYFLIIHRNISTSCFIDYKNKENINLLKQTISTIVDRVFAEANKRKNDEKKVIDIATKLLKENVDIDIIKRTLGLSDKDMEKLVQL